MQGKTHLVMGTALALAILQPDNVRLLIAGGGAAAFGSVISDIDSGNSSAGQEAVKAVAALVLIGIGMFMADRYFDTDIYGQLVQQGNQDGSLPAFLIFLMLCAFGMITPHRSFMHSLTGGALLTGCVWRFFPEGWLYFAVGFGTHLLLDLLNRRGERLFFPLRKTFSLGWFKANGLVNRILFLAGSAAVVILVSRLNHNLS